MLRSFRRLVLRRLHRQHNPYHRQFLHKNNVWSSIRISPEQRGLFSTTTPEHILTKDAKIDAREEEEDFVGDEEMELEEEEEEEEEEENHYTRARGGEFITWRDIENFESDTTETFIKGGGNGGQKVNKVSNCVQLRHVPSGIVIKCQETRSLQQNRKIARKRLKEQLEYILMHPASRIQKRIDKKQRQKSRKRRKQRSKYNLDKNKENEEDNDTDAVL